LSRKHLLIDKPFRKHSIDSSILIWNNKFGSQINTFMKRNEIILLNKLLCLLLVGGLFFSCQNEIDLPKSDRLESKLGPNDHYFQMRAYPDQDYNLTAFKSSMKALKNSVAISKIEVHPTNSQIVYAGFSHGGVFKTINGGATWEPIFDDQAFLSIGVIEIDPNDPETIFVGTGDVNIPGGFFIGNGIYKSTNGGETWSNVGLTEHGIFKNRSSSYEFADSLCWGNGDSFDS